MNYFCFLDFETTGLDPRAGAEPIELACIVADDGFRELAQFERVILPNTHHDGWNPVSREMHRASGLLDAVWMSGRSRPLVAAEFAGFLEAWWEESDNVLHLAGNSVHFDRGFLDVYFPSVAGLFHHRHLDVSSVRMLAERVTTAPPLGGDKPHRAMADVRRSIAELKHWTAALRHAQIPDSWSSP